MGAEQPLLQLIAFLLLATLLSLQEMKKIEANYTIYIYSSWDALTPVIVFELAKHDDAWLFL